MMQSPFPQNIGKMAAPVADNALLLEPNCMYVCMFIFLTYAEVEGAIEINSLSTVLEYDTTYILQSEGSITLGCASGDTALLLRDISCIILQNS